jgi:integrase/recombinase XerD
MRYNHSKEIETKLKGFKTYLQQLGNSENTIRQKSNYTGYFLKWLESERLQAEEARYIDMLNFIDYCNLESFSKKHINTILLSVRNYYKYLKITDDSVTNPATNLYIKGTIKKVPSNSINYQELETLYQNYQTETLRDRRNKAILGLLVYQGITTEELHQLEPNNLKLKEGKIAIRGSRKRNSRILELKPFQILELQEYVTEIRPTLNPENSSQLFISMEGNTNLKNSLHHLFRAIKRMNPNIGNGKQIRASVITNWLKSRNLREVQYMAGHKYVSSTERYQVNNLEELKKNLEKYHPLK